MDVKRLTGHPSEGGCTTAEEREGADKRVLEDPLSRLITNQSHSMVRPKEGIIKLYSDSHPRLLSLPLFCPPTVSGELSIVVQKDE